MKQVKTTRPKGGLFEKMVHESAALHCTGKAVYIDDEPETLDMLHIQLGFCPHAKADILSINTSAALNAPGVAAVLTAADLPGVNDYGHAHLGDDLVFADTKAHYQGQVIFCVAADTIEQARDAAKFVQVDYAPETPIVTIDDAIAANSLLADPTIVETGDPDKAFKTATHQLNGRIEMGAQEQFYLESQNSIAVPLDGKGVRVICATQDPTAVQHLTARILALPASDVTVECRRLGGAFGGKETGATPFGAIAALVALKTGRTAKLRLDRDDDMIITGKRHAFRTDYDVCFDDSGKIEGLIVKYYSNGGCSMDQSPHVMTRAIHHIDNAYFLGNVRIEGRMMRTNLSSANAFRGFGAPQGILSSERILDSIATHLGLDPLAVREVNFYGPGRDVTHYGFDVDDFILPRMIDELKQSSDYEQRKNEIDAFNAKGTHLRRGIALIPVKFGAGYSATFLNQAGALIHIYQDGSIHLNHGGTEMGQGLFIKIAQIVAHEFQINLDRISVSASATDKVPNTSASAASFSTDLNGAAAQNAANIIKERLVIFLSEKYTIAKDQIAFEPEGVRVGNQHILFDDVIGDAYMGQVQLSAAGFFKNDQIHMDPVNLKGAPYYYNCYSSAVVECIVDTLSGETRLLGADILHDVGRSINPAIDAGQIEGGFIQGVGWLTCEEVVWDDKGILKTHAPSTYKIPSVADRPEHFNLEIVNWSQNLKPSIHRSKAVGEPPVLLGVGAFRAISYAISSIAEHQHMVDLDAPATPERVLKAVEDITARV